MSSGEAYHCEPTLLRMIRLLLRLSSLSSGAPPGGALFGGVLKIFDRPKSHSLISFVFSSARRTFSGFMSRCTTPLACMYSSADAICIVTAVANDSERVPLETTTSKSAPPLASSMTR